MLLKLHCISISKIAKTNLLEDNVMAKKEEKKLTKDQAVKKIQSLKDLFNIRFKKVNNQVENPAQYNQIKKVQLTIHNY